MSHFVDASVLLIAIGGPHAHRAIAQDFMRRADRGTGHLHASVEAVQELVFHRMRMEGRQHAADAGVEASDTLVLHDFDRVVLARSLGLIRECSIRGRDAVHAATALLAGFEEIVSFDADFDAVPGLRRVHPADA